MQFERSHFQGVGTYVYILIEIICSLLLQNTKDKSKNKPR